MKKIVTVLIILSVFLTGCSGLTKKIDAKAEFYYSTINLEYWRVHDGPDDLSEIIAKYKRVHPNVNINYKKLRADEYKQKLLEGFALDRSPDVFSLHNTWMKEYQKQEFIGPVPEKITLAYPSVEGSIKKELVIDVRSYAGVSPQTIEKSFLDVVYDDVVIKAYDDNKKLKEQVFGLPLSVDTMAMFYNKDIFNNAGITEPPIYWDEEFQQDVKKITKQNSKGDIIQSGVALGGSDNIERYSDILSLLMMQSGTEMTTSGGTANFHMAPNNTQTKSKLPGHEALRFYTDFANPGKEVYSWNNSMENSLDLFINGKLGMMFGYSYMLPDIKSRGKRLNFSIAPMPQLKDNPPVNFANYWVEVVSNKIFTDPKNLEKGENYAKLKYYYAWDFVQFAAKEKNVQSYLDKTGKPTALKSLIEEQMEDREIGVFAAQLLTAKSWYRGKDAISMENIFKEMINKVIAGKSNISDIINDAAKKVQQTIN
jgi:multiple sugar transport system substrate-binding protein